MSKPEITEFHDDDYHSYTFVTAKGQQVCRFEVDNAHEERSQVHGEVTVYYLFDGEPSGPVFAHQRLNLMTDKRPNIELLTALADVWPWEEFYEHAKRVTIDSFRNPQAPRSLKEDFTNEPLAPFLLEPFVLYQGVSLLFGPGGTGKSMVALSMAIAVASGRTVFGRKPTETGNVLYIDYEDSFETHQRRLAALLNGMDMTMDDLEHDILWLRPPQSVAKMRRQLRTMMRDADPVLVILDSVGLARGGDAMGSEETIRLFFSLNQLGRSVVAIDHVTKEDQRASKMLTPYGSIYTVNSVRLAWAIQRADASNELKTYLNLKQTKRNNVAFHEPLGAEMTFVNEMVEFGDSVQPVLDSVKLGLTDQWWQMEASSAIDKAVEYLETHGPSPGPSIARAIGVKPETLSKKLRDHDGKRVQRVSGSSNPVIWGLFDD